MEILDKIRKLIFGYTEIASSYDEGKHVVAYEDPATSTKVLTYDDITYSRITYPSIYTHSYWDYFIPLAYAYQRPKVLLIGLGGGTTLFQFNRLFGDALSLDVAEISPSIVEVARKMNPGIKANIIIADGAAYVASATGRYDLIILDAYTGSKIPEQFLTSAFISNAKSALAAGGTLAINFVLDTANLVHYSSYLRMLGMAFNTFTLRYRLSSLNEIIIATKGISKDELLRRIGEMMPATKENSFLIADYNKLSKVSDE